MGAYKYYVTQKRYDTLLDGTGRGAPSGAWRITWRIEACCLLPQCAFSWQFSSHGFTVRTSGRDLPVKVSPHGAESWNDSIIYVTKSSRAPAREKCYVVLPKSKVT
ncbi:uncharacterized protein LOC116413829 [Galleria mellonella]|uniref:Uncharacterized protein LOC116413829 n=1 Tax=Galleria mellonella TaxID=7137 RepID=A0A6J3CG39_GALME|nr:uncharacterized protein LOC116413829 [Galleria mellonella]